MVRLTLFDIQIVSKYLCTSLDLINLVKICKKYNELIKSLYFNPIRVTKFNYELFENIETQHVFTKFDYIIDGIKHVYHYNINYSDIDKHDFIDEYKSVHCKYSDLQNLDLNRFKVAKLDIDQEIENIDSNLGTAIRTIVVLIMAWIVVFVTKKQDSVRTIDHRELGFICLSGLATGASWLCYYRALQDGLASVVVPIDKLSILVTILFSYLVFHEKLGKKEAGGLVLIVAGTLGMLV